MNDWIEWHGGECPVDGGLLVQIAMRGKLREDWDKCCAWPAKQWVWNKDAGIIAYRVVDQCATAPATS